MVKSVGVGISLVVATSCAHSARGIVRLDADRVVVESFDGDQVGIKTEGEGRYFPALVGCEVEVEGRGGRKRLQVREWEVIADPGGGQPFVGRLDLGPGGLVLDDRSTGQTLRLDAEGSEALLEHLGRIVLISGYIAGVQQVRVVDWRSLEP